MEARSFSSQPSASRSSPSTTEQVSSSFSPSATPPVLPEGNDHTPRRPTKREIAMLSGSSSPASSNTPTRGLSGSSDSPSTPSATVASTEPSSDPASDAPVSVVLEEDPAALGMSRPASWHSFTLEDSHEADLATVDAISVAEVGEENKHAASEEPIPTTEESPDEMDLRSDVGEASHPRSSAVEPGSTAPPMSELASSIGSLPPSSNLPIVDENTDMTGSTQLPLPPPQPAIVPPLPVIPAGTTMIIQGVVQAAEDPARPPRRRADPSTSSANPESSTNAEGASESTADSSNAPASNAHARLTGTFGEEAEAARRSSQDSENPSGAAELLGALLLAAASATANMLMSDPPGSSNAAPAAPAITEQTPPETNTPADPSQSASAEPTGSRSRPRSSVGVGPRPRPRTMHVPDGDNYTDYLGRSRERPRSLMGSLRDRMFGSGPDEESLSRLLRSLPGSSSPSHPDRGHRRTRSERLGQYPPDEDVPTPPQEDPTRDPIESLRERIASELMRALANRESQAEDPSSSIPSRPSDARSPLSEQSPPPASPTTASPGGLTSVPLSFPSPSAAVTGPADQHPEGSFERFLQDTNTELRRTLQERMNYREAATAVPIVVPVGPSDGSSTEPNPEPTAEADGPSGGVAATSSSEAPTGTRLIHRAPEGVIEPRLNWWRMHRFPARTVAATAPPEPSAPGSSSTEPTLTPQTNADASPSPPATPTPQASTILIPVIVVGIRTAPTTLVQEIGALAAPPPPPMIPEPPVSDRPSPLMHRNGSSSSITIRAPQDRSAPRPSWARALENMTRSLAARRRMERERSQRSREPSFAGPSAGTTSVPSTPTMDAPAGPAADGDASNRDRTRNYLIWVIGGYYPESHPILTSPNLLLNQFDQDDFWGLAELLGQVKPPVASKTDIDQSGLEIIKPSQVAEYEKEGKITSNTSERCLICLSDYEDDEDIRVMSCKHAFHQPCVDKWLEVGRNNCPACRTKGVDVQDTPLSAEASGQSGEPSTSMA
ncbi:hypothetical protein FRC04_009007 [Tulasnella sp. 424]|nr:hypothetical protein FRC04_009007 [Tulasnella sp. 424]KAG8973661.1 hypothetical protein FRC05_008598 [Tulasnella sp. 425]